jgi:hypothetical protein
MSYPFSTKSVLSVLTREPRRNHRNDRSFVPTGNPGGLAIAGDAATIDVTATKWMLEHQWRRRPARHRKRADPVRKPTQDLGVDL